MVFNFHLVVASLLLISSTLQVIARTLHHHNPNGSALAGVEYPNHMSFNVATSSGTSDCGEDLGAMLSMEPGRGTLRLNLKHSVNQKMEPRETIVASTVRDLARIQTLHRRIIEKKNQNSLSRLKKANQQAPAMAPEGYVSGFNGQLTANLKSGVSLGSGEYFMDVFVGTPPKHFSLILDTGSDLNWLQCVPCYDCFDQHGPHYDPQSSSSYRNIGCKDDHCSLVSSLDPPQPCKAENQTCPYFYWYGDSSNTTGDFAFETFTVNLTTGHGLSEFEKVKDVMFGCGHWNRGLFHGAAGLLGLGRGPLSFASQLQSRYGHSFSYCLVDRNSDPSISSKLVFGEDKVLLSHKDLNFTALVSGKNNQADTFYYVQIKSVLVGGETLNIPEEAWDFTDEGSGGTIIDSGTTLSYFAEPAYQIIKNAFLSKVKGYALVQDFPILDPCYNVSGVKNMELPEFGIVFSDGAVWNFPVENYFIELEPEEVVCLAFLGTPRSALSIIGNFQQQNFHMLYDTKRSRLGYAPMNCADV